jgi:hypothetical protein
MARNGHDVLTVAHDDVLALAHHSEPRLFEDTHSVKVIDARDLGQGLNGYFDFANILTAELIVDSRQILADRVLDVLERFGLRGAL